MKWLGFPICDMHENTSYFLLKIAMLPTTKNLCKSENTQEAP